MMRRLLFAILGMMILNTPLYGQGHTYRTIQEIIKIMEASETMYKISTLSDLPDIKPEDCGSYLFPSLVVHEEYPWVEQTEKGYQLVQFPVDTLAFQYLVEGEPAFKAKRYEEARTYYLRAIEASEELYVGYLHLGDTYFFSGNPARALEYYDHAISLNPYDYRCFYYRANACTKLGKAAEAREAYRTALTLKPRHENILNTIRAQQDFLDVMVADITFSPEVIVQQKDPKQVDVFISDDDAHIWMPYALAKAVWVGEPGPGRENPKLWSSGAELEAFLCLLDAYLNQVSEGDITPVPWLDRLVTMAKAGDLDVYLLYEIGARINPDLALTLDADVRGQLKDFITKYVVIDVP